MIDMNIIETAEFERDFAIEEALLASLDDDTLTCEHCGGPVDGSTHEIFTAAIGVGICSDCYDHGQTSGEFTNQDDARVGIEEENAK